MVIQRGKCCSVSELQSSWCRFPKLTSICHHPVAQTHTSHSYLLLHWKTSLCTSWMPHSSNRNSDQQFENKMCYCHQEAGCNFIGLFSTCLQCLMFISLNVKPSSDCSGALQRRSTAVSQTEGKGTGITYLTVTGVHYTLTCTTLWATTTEARTFDSDQEPSIPSVLGRTSETTRDGEVGCQEQFS